MEAIYIEHCTALLPFKLKWVTCHQPSTVEDAIGLMNTYMSMEARHDLIPKAWKQKQGHGEGCRGLDLRSHQGKGS